MRMDPVRKRASSEARKTKKRAISSLPREVTHYRPQMDAARAGYLHAGWEDAVRRILESIACESSDFRRRPLPGLGRFPRGPHHAGPNPPPFLRVERSEGGGPHP